MNQKPPRAYAAELVEAWLTRQSPQPIIDQIPDWCRELATTQARCSCQLIQYWARAGHERGMDAVPKKIKPAVIRYWQHRGK